MSSPRKQIHSFFFDLERREYNVVFGTPNTRAATAGVIFPVRTAANAISITFGLQVFLITAGLAPSETHANGSLI